MSEGQIAAPPSRARLLAIVVVSFIVASTIVAGVVLPAEFHIDPIGIGKITGLMRLSAPVEETVSGAATNIAVARFYSEPFRSDAVDIPLTPSGDRRHADEIEWKVRMKAGQSFVYSWTVDAPAEEFYSDFHGQSDTRPKPTVVSYKEGLGNALNGVMIAPFDGIHGWYFQNQTTKPVVVHLKLSGFYSMRPDPYASE